MVSRKHPLSSYIAEGGSVYNETKIVGNSSAQFRVARVAQQSFRVTLCGLAVSENAIFFKLNYTFRSGESYTK
jgi:hypothetical protein